MDEKPVVCPFSGGDLVRFAPSSRTVGHYQDIERFGVKPDEVREIVEIRDNCYLYFSDDAGGWPWNDFVAV